MVLAYLWVSEFRNIKNQGFNISSKYFFKYDFQQNQLIVEENKRYIEDFFGLDISNITGIIGQNASGKTNLLELILYAIDGGNTKIAKSFFVVFETIDGLRGFEYHLKKTPQCNLDIDFKPYKSKINLKSVFLSNTFDGRDHNFGKSVFNGSMNKLLQVQIGTNVHKNIKHEVSKQLDFFNSQAFDELEKLEKEMNPDLRFDLRPEHVLITTPTWSNILSRAKKFDGNLKKVYKEQYENELVVFCRNFREKVSKINSDKSLIYYTAFLVFIDFILNSFQSLFKKETDLINTRFGEHFDWNSLTIEAKFKELGVGKLKDQKINEIFNHIVDFFSIQKQTNFSFTKKQIDFFKDLSSYNLTVIEISKEGVYQDRKSVFKLRLTKNLEDFLKAYFSATTNLNLTLKIDWLGISSGHKAFISLFSRIHAMDDRITGNNLLLCIDEGDLYFHPKWQTEFVYKLINVMPYIFEKRHIQFILTTHSPFLASDLPKDNLIFLEKDSEGNCRVHDKSNEDFETFGGNIGELYLDAFFLKNRLISYFAASKIRDLIDKVKSNMPLKNKEKILLSLIGNKLLKNSIENLTHDKA